MDQLKELNNRKYLLTLIKSSGKYFFEWSDSSVKMQTVAVSAVVCRLCLVEAVEREWGGAAPPSHTVR